MANNGGPGDSTDPRSWNRYAYAGSDPINAADPSGEFFITCFDPGAESIYDGSCTGDDGSLDGLGFGLLPAPWPGWPNGPTLSWVRSKLAKALAQAAIAAIATDLAEQGTAINISPVPAYLVMKSECWAPAAPQAGSLAYTLEVTYQIDSSNGQPMSAASLAGIAISERFVFVSGDTNLQDRASTWTIYNDKIQPDGTFTDNLSAGGIPGLSNLSGSALQMFTATGFLSNGLPLVPVPLTVQGFGPSTPVLTDVYGPNNVTINGLGLGKNPATECH
jgi:hypothetical protein